MRPLPLIAASRVAGVADLLEHSGVPADRSLDAARIPRRIRDEPTGFLPGRMAWGFLDHAVQQAGLRDWSLGIAARVGWSRAGPWAPPVLRAATLRDAIRTMCVTYVREIAMVELGLTSRGSMAWFWRRRTANVGGWDGNEPAEQYMLGFMLEVVRLAAGPGWLPPHLQLESPATGWGATTDALPGTRIEFGCARLAVGIPKPLLSLPLGAKHSEIVSPGGPAAELPASDFEEGLRQVLRPLISGGVPTEERLSETLGMSPRTLRRRLADKSTSWRRVVGDVLYERAVARLQEDGRSIREISEELGYAHQAHFSRFFRSRTGMAPSHYRCELVRARDILPVASNGKTPQPGFV